MWQIFYCKFLAESNGERILRIDQHFAKLLTKNIVTSLTHSVDFHAKVLRKQ